MAFSPVMAKVITGLCALRHYSRDKERIMQLGKFDAMKTDTEISEHRAVTVEDGIERHHTTVITRQDWHDTPSNGLYAGKSYRITSYYISNAAGYRHVMLRSTSEPWKD